MMRWKEGSLKKKVRQMIAKIREIREILQDLTGKINAEKQRRNTTRLLMKQSRRTGK